MVTGGPCALSWLLTGGPPAADAVFPADRDGAAGLYSRADWTDRPTMYLYADDMERAMMYFISDWTR